MFLAVIAATIVSAASPSPEPTTTPAPIGRVTSISRGTPINKLDVSSTVLTHDQIQAMPQTSVDQILQTIPGIYIPPVPANELHPTAQIIGMRGIGSAFGVRTLVLLDGVPINDGYFRTIDWSQIPKNTIERIEIIRGGGATSLWGNLALGGVINIVTRAPQPGEHEVGFSYGSNDTLTGNVSTSLLSTSKVQIGANFDTSATNGYNLTPPQYLNPYNVSTASHANDGSLSAYLEPSDRLSLYIRGTASGIVENGLVWNNANNSWGNAGVTGGGTYDFSPHESLSGYAWYTNNQFATQNASNAGYTLATPQSGVPYVSQIEDAQYRSFGGSTYVTLGGAQIGFDARTITLGNDHNVIYNSSGVNTAVFNDYGTHQFQGIFAQDVLSFGPAQFTLGVREDYWQAVNAGIYGSSLAGTLTNPLSNVSYAHFDPRAGVKVDLGSGFNLRLVAYQNFSAPGMNQMYRSYVSGATYNNSSPYLIPETSQGAEGGFDYRAGGTDFEATSFIYGVTNYIDYPTLCSTASACAPLVASTGLTGISSVRQYLNVGDATIKGLEFIGSQQLVPNLTLRLGYTRTIAFLTQSNYLAIDPLNSQLGQVPQWFVSAEVDAQATRNLHLAVQLVTFPSFYYNTAHTTLNTAGSPVNLSLYFTPSNKFTYFVSAQNLFNQEYYAQGLTQPSTSPELALPLTVQAGFRLTL